MAPFNLYPYYLDRRLYLYYLKKMMEVVGSAPEGDKVNSEKNGSTQPGSWKIAVTLWVSGILTGVSYCSAVTAAHADGEEGKLVFMVSGGFLVLGCLVGCSLIVASWHQFRRARKPC